MRILHCCICCFYIDGYNYQENIIPRINQEDGNEVFIIASTFSYENNDTTKPIYLEPCKYKTETGIPIERVAFQNLGIPILTNKVKKVKNLYEKIEKINPDVILFHGPSSVEVKTLIKYKKKHEQVKIYIDSHADYYTTGTNWLSKNILQGTFFAHYLKKALPYIEKVLYVSTGCGDFMREVFKVPDEKLEFYSLGGVIPTQKELDDDRVSVCRELDIPEYSIIFLQAGKFDKRKKLVESLREFEKHTDDRLVYLIAGSLSDDISELAKKMITRDSRIKYLGWKNGDELHRYLNACDVYVQPGKVSAIAQDAICRNSIVILNNLPEYKLFVLGNGWLINDPSELKEIFDKITNGKVDIEATKRESKEIAKKYFDYKTLAARLYQ